MLSAAGVKSGSIFIWDYHECFFWDPSEGQPERSFWRGCQAGRAHRR